MQPSSGASQNFKPDTIAAIFLQSTKSNRLQAQINIRGTVENFAVTMHMHQQQKQSGEFVKHVIREAIQQVMRLQKLKLEIRVENESLAKEAETQWQVLKNDPNKGVKDYNIRNTIRHFRVQLCTAENQKP